MIEIVSHTQWISHWSSPFGEASLRYKWAIEIIRTHNNTQINYSVPLSSLRPMLFLFFVNKAVYVCVYGVVICWVVWVFVVWICVVWMFVVRVFILWIFIAFVITVWVYILFVITVWVFILFAITVWVFILFTIIYGLLF